MSDFDLTAFRTRVQQITDDQLIALVSINAGHYVAEAVEIARSEVESRGLSADVQNVIFDVFLNTSGFAGRLILLDEQLMFLSTGFSAAGGSGGGGVPGIIGSETALAKRRVAANNLDFSALDNQGSWIYYLDQIRDCQVKSALIGGKQLIFEVAEENGSITNGVVRCNHLSKSEFENLHTQILDARSKFSTAR